MNINLNQQKLKKGDRIEVLECSIFELMGYDKITGTIESFHSNDLGCSIHCDQTGAFESVNWNDGKITLIN